MVKSSVIMFCMLGTSRALSWGAELHWVSSIVQYLKLFFFFCHVSPNFIFSLSSLPEYKNELGYKLYCSHQIGMLFPEMLFSLKAFKEDKFVLSDLAKLTLPIPIYSSHFWTVKCGIGNFIRMLICSQG